MSPRNYSIDLLRTFSVIYIVAYWHLFNYVPNFPGYANAYTEYLIIVILGIFTLTSGYLLATRPIQLHFAEVIRFYRRRLLRIYPLYAVALWLFWWAGLTSGKVAVKAAVLISMFVPPAPLTLWFITMIMVFYLIAPLLINYAERSVPYLMLCGLILIGLIGYHVFMQPLDLRILMYFPAFAVGVAIARNISLQQYIRDKSWIMALMIIPAFWLFTLGNSATLFGVVTLIPAILIGSVALFVFAEQYGNQHSNIIANISYASFCMYLLHRIVYKYLVILYFPNDLIMQIAYLLVFGTGISFVISYWMQRLYDRGLSVICGALR